MFGICKQKQGLRYLPFNHHKLNKQMVVIWIFMFRPQGDDENQPHENMEIFGKPWTNCVIWSKLCDLVQTFCRTIYIYIMIMWVVFVIVFDQFLVV